MCVSCKAEATNLKWRASTEAVLKARLAELRAATKKR